MSQLILGTQLKRSRETLQLEPEEVSQELNIKLDDLRDWENGIKKPNLENLEALAEFYGRNVDYFLRKSPSPPANIKFRTFPDKTFRSLPLGTRVAIAKFDDLCRTAFEFEKLLERKRKVKVLPLVGQKTPYLAAQEFREKYKMEDKPLRNLKNLLEEEGIRIFELPIPSYELSGFSIWHKDYGPSILVNAQDLPGRKNFTLAHEYAHLLFHHEPSVCQLSVFSEYKEEFSADQFAVELLLPKTGINKDFQEHSISRMPSQNEIGAMASRWHVSIQALSYRLKNLDLVNEDYINKMIDSWKEERRYLRRPKIPTWRKRLGHEFVTSAIDAYHKNYISVGKLAKSLGISIRKAMELVHESATQETT